MDQCDFLWSVAAGDSPGHESCRSGLFSGEKSPGQRWGARAPAPQSGSSDVDRGGDIDGENEFDVDGRMGFDVGEEECLVPKSDVGSNLDSGPVWSKPVTSPAQTPPQKPQLRSRHTRRRIAAFGPPKARMVTRKRRRAKCLYRSVLHIERARQMNRGDWTPPGLSGILNHEFVLRIKLLLPIERIEQPAAIQARRRAGCKWALTWSCRKILQLTASRPHARGRWLCRQRLRFEEPKTDRRHGDNPKALYDAVQAAELDEPGATKALIELKLSANTQFTTGPEPVNLSRRPSAAAIRP